MMGIARAQPILRVGAELTLRTRAWHDTGAGLRRRRTPLGGRCAGARTFCVVEGGAIFGAGDPHRPAPPVATSLHPLPNPSPPLPQLNPNPNAPPHPPLPPP